MGILGPGALPQSAGTEVRLSQWQGLGCSAERRLPAHSPVPPACPRWACELGTLVGFHRGLSYFSKEFELMAWQGKKKSLRVICDPTPEITCTMLCAFGRRIYTSFHRMLGASQVVLVVNNLPANAGDVRDKGSIPGSGRSPGRRHGNPLQYSCLENPMDRGAW